MPKKIFQDVVVSVRPKHRTAKRVVNSDRHINRAQHNDFNRKTGASHSARFVVWGIAISALAFFLFVLLSFFSSTIIKVVPVIKNVTVSGLFTADKNIKDRGLSFKLVVQEHSISSEVPTTSEKEVQRKSSGRIVVYNTYSSKSQRLIKRTRFATSDGYEYMIKNSIVVPGTTVENGEIVPGSIEVNVYADIPGEEYDIGLTDFTIPGFKGGPKFSKFYARSKTPIIGGFLGDIKIASDEDIEQVKIELRNSLKETLLARARAEVPDDFILYDDAVFFSFKTTDADDINKINTNKVEITTEGLLHGILLKKSELSKKIAQNTIASYNNDNISINDLEKLEFAVNNRSRFNPAEDSVIRFTLSGSSIVVWDVDDVSLARDLAGKDKKSFLEIKDEYPGIKWFEAIVRPFWKKIFPDDPNDIIIKIIKEDYL